MSEVLYVLISYLIVGIGWLLGIKGIVADNLLIAIIGSAITVIGWVVSVVGLIRVIKKVRI